MSNKSISSSQAVAGLMSEYTLGESADPNFSTYTFTPTFKFYFLFPQIISMESGRLNFLEIGTIYPFDIGTATGEERLLFCFMKKETGTALEVHEEYKDDRNLCCMFMFRVDGLNVFIADSFTWLMQLADTTRTERSNYFHQMITVSNMSIQGIGGSNPLSLQTKDFYTNAEGLNPFTTENEKVNTKLIQGSIGNFIDNIVPLHILHSTSTSLPSGVSVIPLEWDNSGAVTTFSPAKAYIHKLTCNWQGKVFLTLAQTEHNNMTEATRASQNPKFEDIPAEQDRALVLFAYLVVVGNVTDVSDPAQAVLVLRNCNK